jgi:hypothetical protein
VGALPLAYLSAAVVTGLVVLFHSKIQFKASLQRLISASLVFFAASGLVLQLAIQTESGRRSPILPYIYWVWASVLIVVLMTHFWMTVNEIFNPREARRLIAFISSGGILGGILGGQPASSPEPTGPISRPRRLSPWPAFSWWAVSGSAYIHLAAAQPVLSGAGRRQVASGTAYLCPQEFHLS